VVEFEIEAMKLSSYREPICHVQGLINQKFRQYKDEGI